MAEDKPYLCFVLLFPNIPPNGNFILKDLPGSGKRIDVLCRCLSAGFDWGANTIFKPKIEIIAVIADSVQLRFRYPVKRIPQGEVEWAVHIQDTLRGKPPDFIEMNMGDTKELLEGLLDTKICYLHEDGVVFDEWIAVQEQLQNSFILGDHRGFDSKTLELLKELQVPAVSLGEISYLGSHCIAMVISRFERMSNDATQ